MSEVTNDSTKVHGKCCDGGIIDSATLSQGNSTQVIPILPGGDTLVKLPVVIAEERIQIDMEANIRLEEPALEIKRIRKNLFLEQCKLVPDTKKLFLKGYVRKNIEYATAGCITETAISGKIKHTTVSVPFHCYAEITTITPPNETPNVNPTEIETLNSCHPGRDVREIGIQSKEFFNEKVYCELISVEFKEVDIVKHGERLRDFPGEIQFKEFTEKMVIFITVKLLQLQQVKVPTIPVPLIP